MTWACSFTHNFSLATKHILLMCKERYIRPNFTLHFTVTDVHQHVKTKSNSLVGLGPSGNHNFLKFTLSAAQNIFAGAPEFKVCRGKGDPEGHYRRALTVCRAAQKAPHTVLDTNLARKSYDQSNSRETDLGRTL